MSDGTPVPDYRTRFDLDDRVYAVVGAGQGIGRQTVHALAQAGATVLCVDIDGDRASAVAQEIDRGRAWCGDVRVRGDVRDLGAHIDGEFESFDGFVDIVGVSHWNPIREIDDNTWDATFDASLRHAYLLTQELGGRLVDARAGAIVFISSVSGMTGAPNHAAYGAAKAALNGWVQSVAVEFGTNGVRANAIAPGSILTPRIAAILAERQRDVDASHIPLQRMGTAADIAAAVLFLLSDLASYVTGQTIVVDGGVSAKFPYGTL